MTVILSILADFIAHELLGNWYSYFTLVATLQLLLRPQKLFLDNIPTLFSIFCGLTGLIAIDVTKYGRSGISLLMILGIFSLFYTTKHYFFSAPLLILAISLGFLAFIDIFFVQSFLLQARISLDMTVGIFFGIITNLTLALLGMRGNRIRSFLMNE